MTHSSPESSRKTLTHIAITTLVMVVFLVWIEGGFTSKTAPGLSEARADDSRPADGTTAPVKRENIEHMRSWPGSVSALTVTEIAPKLSGRILDITVRPGNPVKKDQVLVRVDNRDALARLGEAKAGLAAAEAEAVRARADSVRLENLHQKEAATRQALDTAQATAKAGEAGAARARDIVKASEVLLSETTLKAPFDSTIVERHQEPGDMALPGVPILTLQQTRQLRIESEVPSSCAGFLALGSALNARIGNPPRDIPVIVDEITPSADPRTRTVRIKARLPVSPDLTPGQYGALYQACGQDSVLLIPASAVTRIGQLESVRIIINGRPTLRHVKTGQRHGEAIIILSGLNEGDIVLIEGDRR